LPGWQPYLGLGVGAAQVNEHSARHNGFRLHRPGDGTGRPGHRRDRLRPHTRVEARHRRSVLRRRRRGVWLARNADNSRGSGTQGCFSAFTDGKAKPTFAPAEEDYILTRPPEARLPRRSVRAQCASNDTAADGSETARRLSMVQDYAPKLRWQGKLWSGFVEFW
jgi:hypothetical protein